MLEHCPNCGTDLAGCFCHDCGQKDIGPRLDTRTLLHNAFEALTEMDSKLWRTLRELTLAPGQVAANYAAGERAKYINPIKYFITVFTLYLAVLIISGGLEAEIRSAIKIDDADVTAEQQEHIIFRVARAGQEVMREYRNLITFLAIPLFAFSIRWQYFRANRNYAETLSFVCFVSGHVHLLAIPLVLLQWITGSFQDGLRIALMVVYFFFSAKVFYEMGWIKTVLATPITVLLYAIAGLISATSLIALRFFEVI